MGPALLLIGLVSSGQFEVRVADDTLPGSRASRYRWLSQLTEAGLADKIARGVWRLSEEHLREMVRSGQIDATLDKAWSERARLTTEVGLLRYVAARTSYRRLLRTVAGQTRQRRWARQRRRREQLAAGEITPVT
jgi:hypothetical protein